MMPDVDHSVDGSDGCGVRRRRDAGICRAERRRASSTWTRRSSTSWTRSPARGAGSPSGPATSRWRRPRRPGCADAACQLTLVVRTQLLALGQWALLQVCL